VTDAPMACAVDSFPGGSTSSALIAITADDYNSFEGLLKNIQTAYSNGDLAKLHGFATPEMLGHFSEQLSSNSSRGVENKVEAVKIEQGDLSEVWSEAGLDYATSAMRFSMIDRPSRRDGRVKQFRHNRLGVILGLPLLKSRFPAFLGGFSRPCWRSLWPSL
jgi:Tim44-like domain